MAQAFDENFWDELYGSKDKLWSGNPNAHLVAQASELPVGHALDVGSGEGGDAIWLASRGWSVTGIDLSTVALARAREHAAEAGAEIAKRIEFKHIDLATWEPPQDFDLVSAHYMHLPQPLRDNVYSGLASAVRPGGTLLVVGHEKSEHNAHMHDTDTSDFFFDGDELAALLSPTGWEIVTNARAAGRSMPLEDGGHLETFDVVFRARRQ